MRSIKEGSPYPRGATPDRNGTNFSLFSDHATSVTLCLFSPDGKTETERIDFKECTNGVWHAYLEGIQPGQLYGYRVTGPWAPLEGLRFNKNKLLLDPYARKLHGGIQWDDALYGYTISDAEDSDLVMDLRDSAAFMPKAIVVGPEILAKAERPNIRWPKTIIYEAHVKGLTMQHPLIPHDIRGTFKALADPILIAHLHRIGITAIELLPVHAFLQDRHLLEKA
jgi:glycogen operon protein